MDVIIYLIESHVGNPSCVYSHSEFECAWMSKYSLWGTESLAINSTLIDCYLMQ